MRRPATVFFEGSILLRKQEQGISTPLQTVIDGDDGMVRILNQLLHISSQCSIRLITNSPPWKNTMTAALRTAASVDRCGRR
ncbi:hypothetical protein [Paenibacillus solani]|uniref:Uncharacterized protein n=1 Tax=Paenibacillus solani TaxID=1705565 RepID=A0A0M1N1D4_9BACL|nr:hypothetical protein [Paenibacillus solani]KOR75966.1 hypothetical protein AM231_25230 [Paenibacillus solani]